MSSLLPPGATHAPHSPTSYHPTPSIAPSSMAPSGDDPGEEDILNLRAVVGVLRRNWRLVLGITVVVGGIAGLVAYRAKPVFRASAVIRIANTRQSLTAGLDNPVMDKIAGTLTDPVLSQIQVLQSRGVAEEVARRHPLGLRVIPDGISATLLRGVELDSFVISDTLSIQFDDSGYAAQGHAAQRRAAYGATTEIDGVRFAVESRPSRRAGRLVVVSQRAAVEALLKDLDARVRKSTDAIDVSYQANDPLIAQQVVNVAVAAFQEVNARSAQQQSRRRREFVEAQLTQTDSILSDAQHALSTFASTRQVYGSDQRIAAGQSGLMDLEMKRGELSADRKMYRSLLDGLQQARGRGVNERLNAVVSSPGIASNPVVLQLFTQLTAFGAARDSLTTGVWASARTNPDVQRLDTLIAATEMKLTGAVRSHIDALDARISALDELKTRTATQLQQLPATQAEEARLVQRVEATRRMADQLREEYQKARIAEAVEAGQVEVVDLADLPMLPIGRGPLFKVALGFIVGLMLGSGAAFLREHLDTAIRRRDEIEQVLRVPGLAIIPQILPGKGGQGRSPLARLTPGAALAVGARNGDADRGPHNLITLTDARSSGAEAFRALRTSLIFSQAVQSLRTLVITSPLPQDGKTTTAANLAVTFAQQGMRVVLVDCDLRRARLHNVFGVPREPGISQAIAGQMPLAQVMRPTQLEKLFFISAGALPPNPSELLGSTQMRATIDALREQFDVVLLDTPPVHAAADALILGRAADGVVMVVRAGHTARAVAQDAIQRLATVGARVVGAVLNDPDHKVPGYGGYYYYDYYGADA